MSAPTETVQCAICDRHIRVEPEPKGTVLVTASTRRVAATCTSCGAVVCRVDGAGKWKCRVCGSLDVDKRWLLSIDYDGEDLVTADCVRCGDSLDGVVLATDRLTLSSGQLGRQCRDCGAVTCLDDGKALGATSKLGVADWMQVICPGCGSLGGLTGALVSLGSPVQVATADQPPALAQPEGEVAAIVAELANERWRGDPEASESLARRLAGHVSEVVTETLAGSDQWGGVLQIARLVELGVPWPLDDVSPGEALSQVGNSITGSIVWVRALGRVGLKSPDGQVVPTLLQVLSEHQWPAMRATAAVYLASMPWDDRVVPGLTKALVDSGDFTRDQVPELGGPGLAAWLLSGGLSVLESTKTMYVEQIAAKALEVLEALPDAAVLLAELDSTDGDRRQRTIRALGWMGDPADPRIEAALAATQNDPTRKIAKAAKKALQQLQWRATQKR